MSDYTNPFNKTEDENDTSPINLNQAQMLVEGFLSRNPREILNSVGYEQQLSSEATKNILLLESYPQIAQSDYTGKFLNFGEPAPGRRCEIHAINSPEGISWVHFAAADPELKVFEDDHVTAEIILIRSGFDLEPLDLFCMAMFARFGGSSDCEIDPESKLEWENDRVNLSFKYPFNDKRTKPWKTYEMGFRKMTAQLYSGQYDAFIRTAETKSRKFYQRKWPELVFPKISGSELGFATN